MIMRFVVFIYIGIVCTISASETVTTLYSDCTLDNNLLFGVTPFFSPQYIAQQPLKIRYIHRDHYEKLQENSCKCIAQRMKEICAEYTLQSKFHTDTQEAYNFELAYKTLEFLKQKCAIPPIVKKATNTIKTTEQNILYHMQWIHEVRIINTKNCVDNKRQALICFPDGSIMEAFPMLTTILVKHLNAQTESRIKILTYKNSDDTDFAKLPSF